MQNLALMPVDELKNLLSEVVRAELLNHIPAPAEPFADFPELLTRRQTAQLLGVSLASLDNWTASGRLRKHRIGVSVRFRKSEVLNALSSLQKFQRQH
jgi:excisionase family DNA binding protein